MMKKKFILNLNPATGEPIEKIKCSSTGEIASAVKLARKAYKAWKFVPLKNRIAAVRKIAGEFKKEKVRISRLITDEMGKVHKSSGAECQAAISEILQNIDYSEKAFKTEVFKEKGLTTEVYRIPFGVTAVLTPWNFPAAMPQSLLTPAILSGNTVVFKPSENTPLTGKAIYNVYNKYLPKGVINLIQGAEEVGEHLINSDIDMVAFVGSQEVGKKIMAAASRNLNRIILELGGKDPMIVLKDANLEEAATFAVIGSLSNSGQVCVSVERIYVDDKIANKFERLVLEKVKKIKVGDGYKNVDMGPMVNTFQRDSVLEQISEAVRKGAKLIYGGNKIDRKGYFMEPTVLTNLTDKHDIMVSETFGPVVCIQRVRNEEEAIEKANQTSFGLGATVWTKRLKKGIDLAKKIEAGMIGVNRGIGGVSGTPWVGIKQSGYGYLGSVEGLRHFTVPKKISYKN